MNRSCPELEQAYHSTDYRVRLATGGHASIRLGLALPAPLAALAQGQAWAFLTAWNPDSIWREPRLNRSAQAALRDVLQGDPKLRWYPGIGVGTDGWREPSLWIVGIQPQQLQSLAQQFGQRAWLAAAADGRATLYYRSAPSIGTIGLDKHPSLCGQ